MIKKIIYILLFAMFCFQNIYGQDSQFSQFYSSPLYLGPSFAGGADQSRLIANYRSQWVNLPQAYSTYAVSFDHFINKYNSGIGLIIMRDQEGGIYNTTLAGLSYAYNIDVNQTLKIRPGLRASYYNRNVDYSELEFADAIYRDSPTSIETPKNEHINHYDFAFSLVAHTSNIWIGATGDHLLALNKQFANDITYPSLKLSAYGGYRFQFAERIRTNEKKYLSFTFFYKSQAGFQQLDLGVNYEQEPFRIGLWFRGIPTFSNTADLNALVLLAGYSFKDILINYSYDISMSRLLSATGGAHEISIAWRFNMGYEDKQKRAALPCPDF